MLSIRTPARSQPRFFVVFRTLLTVTRIGPLRFGSALVDVPVYVAFVTSYVPSVPVHVWTFRSATVVATNVAETAAVVDAPPATATPATASTAATAAASPAFRALPWTTRVNTLISSPSSRPSSVEFLP